MLALCGCTTERQTDPARTATEQLLILTAADRAANKLALQISKGSQVFLDATNFEGIDGAAILSRQGGGEPLHGRRWRQNDPASRNGKLCQLRVLRGSRRHFLNVRLAPTSRRVVMISRSHQAS